MEIYEKYLRKLTVDECEELYRILGKMSETAARPRPYHKRGLRMSEPELAAAEKTYYAIGRFIFAFSQVEYTRDGRWRDGSALADCKYCEGAGRLGGS